MELVIVTLKDALNEIARLRAENEELLKIVRAMEQRYKEDEAKKDEWV